jgi:lipoate---protein ligase
MFDLALRSSGGDPFRNLAIEEALLERGFEGDSALLLYVNEACVVIGRNQNPWVEVSPDSGLPLLRRQSGGGAVYQDEGNLNWALIVRRSRHDHEAELALVARALLGLGIETRSGPRGGLFYAGGGPYDGAKLSGTARRISSSRVLHHGTLLVDADLARLASSLGGMEVESSRGLSSVRSSSANLSAISPGLGLEDVALALARELAGREPEPSEGRADRTYTDEAAHRLAAWDWIWGSTPAFCVGLPWSGGRALFEVKGGVVASASGPGSELLSAFMGRSFEYGLPREALRLLEGGLGLGVND